jgi:hypothetical protein
MPMHDFIISEVCKKAPCEFKRYKQQILIPFSSINERLLNEQEWAE